MLTVAILALLLLAGCKKKIEAMEKVDLNAPTLPTEPEQPLVVNVEADVTTIEEKTTDAINAQIDCTLNSECAAGSFCIQKTCTNPKDLINTNCDKLCTVKEVVIETSDGNSYTLPPGKGDYTAAGAIDWTIQRLPAHCKSTSLKIPITVFKRNYQTVLGDEAILLGIGETSAVITHPINKRVAFSMTVKDIIETC